MKCLSISAKGSCNRAPGLELMKSKVEVACLTQNPALDNPPQVLVNYHPKKLSHKKIRSPSKCHWKANLSFLLLTVDNPISVQQQQLSFEVNQEKQQAQIGRSLVRILWKIQLNFDLPRLCFNHEFRKMVAWAIRIQCDCIMTKFKECCKHSGYPLLLSS